MACFESWNFYKILFSVRPLPECQHRIDNSHINACESTRTYVYENVLMIRFEMELEII